MSSKLPPDKNPRYDDYHQVEDINDINELDVPTYDSQHKTETIYDRAGRAAPEHIDPADANTTVFETPVTTTSSTALNDDYTAPATVATDVPVAYDDEVVVEKQIEDPRRGTIDLGLLILRILAGGFLILTSVATFFRLGGNEGLSGLDQAFSGYAYGNSLAVALPTAQLAAGVFLLLGLLTPVAAMVATVATGFMALHAIAAEGAGFNIFAWPETVWLAVILLGLSVVLQFTGPGLYSFDTGRGWARRPLVSSWIFIVLGIVIVIAVWIFGTGINPFA
ncbi:DoxX family protein [Corynebacterium cystitidis]|uniref:DoxX family protein n=1 Tax=Corynebacterium cystitidis TaxID=35757 RepID=UPI00211F3124|nr:DoxX family protein [Corynebacterium cystitidis]